MNRLILLILLGFFLFSCKSTLETVVEEPIVDPVEGFVEYDHSYRVKAYKALDKDKKVITSNSDVELILYAYSWAFRGSNCINPLVETLADLYKYDSFNITEPGMGDLIFFVDSSGEPYRVGILESIVDDSFSFLMVNSKDRLTYYKEFLDMSKVEIKRLKPILK